MDNRKPNILNIYQRYPEKHISQNSYNPVFNDKFVFGRYIKNINISIQKQSRSGVIVYRIINGKIIYGLGMDNDHVDITDFSGGVSGKDKDVINAGLREFTQESLGVFGLIEPEEVTECFAIYSRSMILMFLHLDFDINTVNHNFDHIRTKVPDLEVIHLKWLTHEELINAINSDHSPIYERLRSFLSLYIQIHGDFRQYL